MAVQFTGTNSWLKAGESVVGAGPTDLSMSLWAYSNDLNSNLLMQLGKLSSSSDYIGIQQLTDTTIRSHSHIGFGASTAVVEGTWNHILFTHEDGGNFNLYVDGGAPTTTTPAGSVDTLNETAIGSWAWSVVSSSTGGMIIAEAAIWNAVLTAGDATSLAGGARPSVDHATNLVLYMPLSEDDSLTTPEVGAFTFASNGTVALIADHPVVDGPPPPPAITRTLPQVSMVANNTVPPLTSTITESPLSTTRVI